MFIPVDDIKWQELVVNSSHDVYHLPGFSSIEARLLNGIPLAWYYETQTNIFLIPLISRPIIQQPLYKDLVSPYGYPGILSAKQIDNVSLKAVLKKFNEEARGNGYVSSFIRLNPFINRWRLSSDDYTIKQIFLGKVVSVDLSIDLSKIRENFSENHLRNIRKLQTHGYKIAMNDWTYLDDFIDIYYQTMHRRGANSYYFFPKSYFYDLKDLLKENLLFISVISSSGGYAAGGLFFNYSDVIHYHLGATSDKYIHFSPSKLMMDAFIEFAKSNCGQNKKVNLGGGVGSAISDGLFRFKHGFGTHYHEYSTLQLIHLPEIYDELTNKLNDKPYSRSFFPEYRKTEDNNY